MPMREDKEFAEFRDLMQVPDKFEDGFNWGSVLMALFVGLVMAPASVYMGLVAGVGIGGAAQWVTVLLYVEVCRRAFKKLGRAELFILFYMSGAALSMGGGDWLWRQFLPQSEQLKAAGLTQYIPSWYAPSDPTVLGKHSFFQKAWLVPIGIGALFGLMGRIDSFGLGYVMYRLTVDVERLPFPMAPVGASGMMALADSSNESETWRVKVFTVGAALGIAFGAVYLAVPNITGAFLAKPIRILPMPFIDLTPYTEKILPAIPITISLDLGGVLGGMVLPFNAVIGALFGMIATCVANPMLYHAGLLGAWEPGLGALKGGQSNFLEFFFSWGIGMAVAVAVVGFIHLHNKMKERKHELDEAGAPTLQWKRLFNPPAGRGDIPIWVGMAIYLVQTTFTIGFAYYLVNYASGPLLGPKFPLWLLIVYGYVYTPLISYVSVRMAGIVGGGIDIPYLQQATFILSGYKGAAIWFAPIPMSNYAGQSVNFRTMELTGCKFTSVIKAEFIIYPLSIVGTLIFANFLWSIGPVPSDMFPYANEFWEYNAYGTGMTWSATLPGEAASPFREAFKPEIMGTGFGVVMIVYAILARFNLPIFLVYGIIGGLSGGGQPGGVIPTAIGAIIGQYVLRRRFGEKWPQYRIVFLAGFGAGMGLIGMLSLGLVFMAKSASMLPGGL